jgi:hypothetical protein
MTLETDSAAEQPSRGLPPLDDHTEALRESQKAELDAIRAEVEAQIEYLKRVQIEDELAEQIGTLESLLASIDLSINAAVMGNAAQISAINVPAIASTVQGTLSHVSAAAEYQTAHHFAEMTHAKIETMHAQHDNQAQAFARYERQSASRIEELAAANGTDLSGWRTSRDELLDERDEARKSGDRLRYFQADALLAHNNVYGLVKADAPQAEIDEAREQATAAEQRYLDEVRLRAVKEARAQGMTKEETVEHIAQSGLKAQRELASDKAELMADAVLSPEQQVAVGASAETSEAAKELAQPELAALVADVELEAAITAEEVEDPAADKQPPPSPAPKPAAVEAAL